MTFKELFQIYFFHWLPEKAIYIGGHSLPWDARCSGLYVGMGFGLLWSLVTAKKSCRLPRFSILSILLILFLPMCLDITTLYLSYRLPSNDIRYLTGIFFGSSFCMVLFPIFNSLFVNERYDTSNIASHKRLAVYIVALICLYNVKKFDTYLSYIFLTLIASIGFLGVCWMLFGNVLMLFCQVKKWRSKEIFPPPSKG